MECSWLCFYKKKPLRGIIREDNKWHSTTFTFYARGRHVCLDSSSVLIGFTNTWRIRTGLRCSRHRGWNGLFALLKFLRKVNETYYPYFCCSCDKSNANFLHHVLKDVVSGRRDQIYALHVLDRALTRNLQMHKNERVPTIFQSSNFGCGRPLG